jgi:hypothetical protein
MRVADYRQLRVYELDCESAIRIFELSRSWPSEERYSLTDQIRRSSRSVCTNMAEARRKRRYEAAFTSKLRDHYDHICRQLTSMMGDAPSWCGARSELREISPEYVVGASEQGERECAEPSPTLHTPHAPHAPRS